MKAAAGSLLARMNVMPASSQARIISSTSLPGMPKAKRTPYSFRTRATVSATFGVWYDINRSSCNSERARIEGVGGDGPQFLLGARNGDAETLLIEEIELVRHLAIDRQIEAAEGPGGKRNPFEDDRFA